MINWVSEETIMYEPNDLQTFVEELVTGGHLEGPALGIAKLVAAEGPEGLSPKQKFVFDNYVLADNVLRQCARCS